MVEDDKREQKRISGFIKDYFKDELAYTLDLFDNAEQFFYAFTPSYDLIFMDINLSGEDGLSAARKVREKDRNVLIVFMTSLAQYAIKGYEVQAYDFIIKPVEYGEFIAKMKKYESVLAERDGTCVTIKEKDQLTRLSLKELIYIEIDGHYLAWHTTERVIKSYGKMTDAEGRLAKYGFIRINKFYLVNLRYVESISGFTMNLRGGDKLIIAHTRKKEVMQQFCEWAGNGIFGE